MVPLRFILVLILLQASLAFAWHNPSLMAARHHLSLRLHASPISNSIDLLQKSASRNSATLYMSEKDEDDQETPDTLSSEVSESAPVSETATKEEETAAYPIDLPSPILLSTSMVLAIASTGSLFELLGDNSVLPFAVTAAIVVIGFPLGIFLFYASILKATAETEADDKEFLSRGNRF